MWHLQTHTQVVDSNDNKEKIAEQRKQYYNDKKEKIKQYYNDNIEKIKERQKQYYDDNKEKRKERQKQYYDDNKEKRKQKVICDNCGSEILKETLSRHKRSKKCLTFHKS